MLCGLPGLSIVVISAPVCGVGDDPFRRAELRRVERLAVGRERDAIGAAAFVALLPHQLVGQQVVGRDAPAGRHVQPRRRRVRGDALDRFLRRHRTAVRGRRQRQRVGSGNALDELVPVIDVEDQDAGAAVVQVVAAADTRQRGVEEALRALGPGLPGRNQTCRADERDAGESNSHEILPAPRIVSRSADKTPATRRPAPMAGSAVPGPRVGRTRRKVIFGSMTSRASASTGLTE